MEGIEERALERVSQKVQQRGINFGTLEKLWLFCQVTVYETLKKKAFLHLFIKGYKN